jgi:hypothetical protein
VDEHSDDGCAREERLRRFRLGPRLCSRQRTPCHPNG